MVICAITIYADLLWSPVDGVIAVESTVGRQEEVDVEAEREVGKTLMKVTTKQEVEVVAGFLSSLFADSSLASCLPVLLADEMYYSMLEVVSEEKNYLTSSSFCRILNLCPFIYYLSFHVFFSFFLKVILLCLFPVDMFCYILSHIQVSCSNLFSLLSAASSSSRPRPCSPLPPQGVTGHYHHSPFLPP